MRIRYKEDYLTENEIQIIKEYYPKHGSTKCKELMPYRSQQNIRQAAFRHGVKIDRDVHNLLHSYSHDKDRKYVIDESLFTTVKDPEIAYLLGLIWADGYVHPKGHAIKFTSLRNDMEALKGVFDFTGNWKTQPDKKTPHILIVECFNYRLCKHLQTLDYHIKSGASAIKVLNTIPDNLKHYWWRGYLDGDGNIDTCGYHNTLNFSSVYNQNWDFVYTLHPTFTIRRTISKTKNSRYSNASIYRKDNVRNTLAYIYQNYETDHIGLSRKYEIYKSKYLLTI